MVCLFRVVLISLYFSTSLGQLLSPDILALLQFKKGIKHDPSGYLLNSWNDESIGLHGCPSSWNGIVCNAGHVSEVILDNLGLSAEADLSVFVNLTKLVKLSMANNSISGIIPDDIGSLHKLQYLDISNNLFSSFLPSGIGNLASLKNVSLAGNNFSGLIPSSISELTSIQSLDFSHNSFFGPIPSSFMKLGSLVHLNLSENRFTKKIPKGFELLSSLEVLDLHGNMLDGNLDEEFLLLSSAKYIDLSDNQLDNSGPQKQKFLPRISETIKYLNLSHNKLTGSLIGQTQLFENLNVLDLSYNQLSGDFPEFNFVYDLEILRLSNNKFSGFVPNDLLKGDPVLLIELDLSGNNLTGPISFITSTTLRVLNMSSNSISGELPLLTGDCAILDLSNNQFEGNLTKMSKWRNVEFLDLSQNRLTGLIPETMSELLHLNHLNLSGNSLIGSIPKAVTQFPKLSILDMSYNRLDGPLLASLFTMPTLQELHLSSNSFDGNLEFSTSPSDKSNLRVVDLSHNHLGGYFPEKFGFLNGLEVINLNGNNLSGSLPTSMNDMSSLTSLDISQNHFTGSLPSNLSSSLQSFNASYNDLSGVVPKNLMNFSHSSFYPGNSKLQLPSESPRPQSSSEVANRNSTKTLNKVIIVVACVIGLFILILLAIFVYYIHISRKPTSDDIAKEETESKIPSNPRNLVISAGDIITSRKAGSSSEIISHDEKAAIVVSDFSPPKTSQFSSSPESGDSLGADNLAKFDVGSPDRLVGELYFLDDTMSLTPEELSRAPAEVLGRSSHGTSYRATLDNGMFLTVKWLREGVARPKKDFAKEARKFANIRHPNVVAYRGYYWGPTQHEKLILSEYILPGSLASFLYDRPGRKGPPLTWFQRLKIAVDIARGLNYLHFDRALPHGNLKSNNILLDTSELNARVADYCLHRLMTQTGTIEQILDSGLLGYRAPELAASKKPIPSFKSDVYAFGVIVLELLTGRCAGEVVSGEDSGIDLTEWVRVRVAEGHGSDCFDSILIADMENPNVGKGTNEVLGIALRCIRSVSDMPGIKTIYEDLSSI